MCTHKQTLGFLLHNPQLHTCDFVYENGRLCLCIRIADKLLDAKSGLFHHKNSAYPGL